MPQADLSSPSRSMQQWEVTTVDVLRARQQVQDSRATTFPIRQELDPTPKRVVDRRIFMQTSSEEVQHLAVQSPPVSQGTKRRREPELDPPTSKHARIHTNPNQPQQPSSQATKDGYQSKSTQRGANDVEHVRSKHISASTNGTALHAPIATPPKTSARTILPMPPIVLGKSTLVRDQLQFLPDGTYFLHLSRVKCVLEDTINSDEGVSWITHWPEAPRMISKISAVLEDMSCCVKRSELDFGAREWAIWYSLDKAVERRRIDELRRRGAKYLGP
jgi:hypothetical protein